MSKGGDWSEWPEDLQVREFPSPVGISRVPVVHSNGSGTAGQPVSGAQNEVPAAAVNRRAVPDESPVVPVQDQHAPHRHEIACRPGPLTCDEFLALAIPPRRLILEKLQTVYVIAGGWHTEIGVPVDALPKPLAALPDISPDAHYVVFGWGQRNYYMARNPGIGDLLAATVPGPSVVLVVPLWESPIAYFAAGTTVFAIPVSQAVLDRLARFVWASIEKDPQNQPRRLGAGPYPGSAFYASGLTYSLANTCNTWTAEALHVSGLPVSASGVVFAHEVVDQVRGPAVQGR